MKNNTYIIVILLIFPFAVFSNSGTYAQGIGIYAPHLGSGDAITISTAFSGITQVSGLSGGRKNPASYFVERNELLIEGDMWDSVPIQSGVSSPGARFGVSEIGYLIKAPNSVFTFSRVPRNRIHASGGPYENTDKKDRLGHNEIEAAYAVRIKKTTDFGVAVRWVRGEFATGSLIHDVPGIETIYRPSFFEIAFGLRKKNEKLSWGIVIETPAFGRYEKGVDNNVDMARDKSYHSFKGAPALIVGAGYAGKGFGLDADFSLRSVENVSSQNTAFDDKGLILENGIALNWTISDKSKLYSGIRSRMGTVEESRSLIPGLGISYLIAEDITLNAGAGMLLPISGGYSGTTLEDLYPFSIKIGILYHGE
ncbi:MAG: hypothetical protein P9L92_02855 [Candidatus Electryonea clarkiae]|nr:hypothetical protein [Candidatus Electryonea clarkiae]MDP8288813.1 hypothetical protein [Candidatus Electryonea clarkiae]